MTKQELEGAKDASARVSETARQERSQGGQPSAKKSADPDVEGGGKKSNDDKLSTGHATPGDGGDNEIH